MYHYIVKQRVLYVAYVVLMVASCVTSVGFAFVLSEIFNCAQERNLKRLFIVLFAGTLFLIVSVSLEYFYGIVKNKILCHARQKLKNDLFEKILHKSVLEFENRNLGEYMNELQNNLNLYEELYFKNILQIPMVVFSFLIAVIACVYISPVILFVILMIGVFISIMVKKLGKCLEKTTSYFAKQSAEYSSEIKDDFQGHRTICAYYLWGKIIEKHRLANVEIEKAKKINENTRTLFVTLNELAGLTSTLFIMPIAAVFAIRGDYDIGIVMAFGQLSGKIISPIMTISDTWVQFQSSKRLTENYRSILFPGESAEFRVKKNVENGNIILNNVSLTFGNHRILDAFSECFEQGKKYLVVGESGSGKSTLLHVIAGMYQVDSGNVWIGGTAFDEADGESLGCQIQQIKAWKVHIYIQKSRGALELAEKELDELRNDIDAENFLYIPLKLQKQQFRIQMGDTVHILKQTQADWKEDQCLETLYCYMAALFDAQRSLEILTLWETTQVQQFVEDVTEENKMLWLIMFKCTVMEQDLEFFERYFAKYKLVASEKDLFEVKKKYASLYNVLGLEEEKKILKVELLDSLESLSYNAYIKEMYRRKIEEL